MARQTRDERRKRRELAGAPVPARSRREVTRAVAETAPVAAPPPGQRGGFVGESIAELRKVEWPNQHALVSGTAVVIVACIIVGFYLWLNDELWKYVVQHVLLR